MNLSVFDLAKCLYRWKIRIIAVVFVMVFLAGSYVDRIQTYSAQTLIKFNDASVSGGTFPNGTEFNVYDLASPKVLSRALTKLGSKLTVDSVRSKITITPVIPTSVTEIQEAKQDDGEEYEYYPTTYTIVYEGSVGQSSSSVRNILDEVVLEYINYYSETYHAYAVIDNMVADTDIFTYDYIERADIMSDNITSIMTSLEGYNSGDSSFRSALTGMSFMDLYYEYSHMKEFTMSRLYADIYYGKIALNRQSVEERYREKANREWLEAANYTDQANMTKNKMDAFTTANQKVPNAYNDTRTDSNDDRIAVIDDVNNESQKRAVTATYDSLIMDYANQLVAANGANLNAAYYWNVADTFASAAPEGLDTVELEQEIEETIEKTVDRMNELYKTLINTVSDYNDKQASKHITLLTGVRCYENVSKALFALVAIVLSGGMMVVIAVLYEFVKKYREIERAEKIAKEVSTEEVTAEDTETAEAEETSEADVI